MKILSSKYAVVLTAILILQAAVYYAAETRSEALPAVAPLTAFPQIVDNWQSVRETPIEKEVQDILKADDTLSRVYLDSAGQVATLFVAFFKTQRTGQAPHSPKNCLPGSGWLPSSSGFVDVKVAGESLPFSINR